LYTGSFVVVKSTRKDKQLNDVEQFNEQSTFLSFLKRRGLKELVNSLEAKEGLKYHKHRLSIMVGHSPKSNGAWEEAVLQNTQDRDKLCLSREHFAMIANQSTKSGMEEYAKKL
jgi:hypothetical protein